MTEADSLGALWRQASAMPIHGTGCACSTPMSIAVDPKSFELDVLDFVTEKHALDDWTGWSRALEVREGAEAGEFTAWLLATCSATLDEQLERRVIDDVIVVLKSRIEHATGRFASPSVKGAGWLTASASYI
jgi:hypothetical protein